MTDRRRSAARQVVLLLILALVVSSRGAATATETEPPFFQRPSPDHRAEVIFVHPDGSGSGSESAPADLGQAIDAARGRCVTIRLSAGHYPPTTIADSGCLSIVGPDEGIASFRSNSLHTGAGLAIERSRDVDVVGVHIADSHWGVRIVASADVLIADSHIERIGREAIHVWDNSTGVVISSNHIHDTGVRPGVDERLGMSNRTFGEGIFIGTHDDPTDTTNNVTIIGNDIHHTGAEAIDLKNGTHNITVRRNVVHDLAPQVSGAIVAHVGTDPTSAPDIRIEGNIIWGIRTGSPFTDGNAIVVSSPATVRANVIWDVEHRGILVTDVYGVDRRVDISRNVVFGTGFEPIEVRLHEPSLPPPAVVDNLGDSIFRSAAFSDSRMVNGSPTIALARLVALLEGDTPIAELDAAVVTADHERAAPRAFPIRNENLDRRSHLSDTPAAAIEWLDLTETSRETIATGVQAPGRFFGQFRTQCSFSHFAYDDPIGAPGEPGASPLVMYFGNTRAGALSTYESLRDTGTSSCNGFEANRSAHWLPAVFDSQGNARIPSRLEVHAGSHGNTWSHVAQPPAGLAMTTATAAASPYIEWACEEGDAETNGIDRPLQQRQDTIPRCSPTATLLGHVRFPQCIADRSSVSAASVDSSGLLSYPRSGYFAGDCPDGTDYMTAIEYFVAWGPADHDGRTDEWWLSTDITADGGTAANGSTLRAGWYGAWNPTLFEQIHSGCVARLADCRWDLVDDNRRLLQVEHFDRESEAAYDGPSAIPAARVSELLCPGDRHGTATDAATCTSRVLGYGQAVGATPPATPTPPPPPDPADPMPDSAGEAASIPRNPSTDIPVYDTAWQMLVRGTSAQADQYFAALSAHGFTGAWAGVIHHSPATYVDSYNGGGQVGQLIDGQVVLSGGYIQHVRAILDAAQRHGQKVGLVVAWQNTYLPGGATETGHRAQVHGTIHSGNAYDYGRRMVENFGFHPAVSMWVFGGDAGHNNTDANKEVWRQMARGVRDSGSTLPISYHTPTSEGEQGTFRQLNYAGEWWLDMVAPETGHQQPPSETERELRAAVAAYGLPVWQGEPRYYNISFDWIAPAYRNPGVNEVRADALAAQRAGVSGYVYGDAGRWNWCAGFGDTTPCDANNIAASFGPGETAVIDVFRAQPGDPFAG